MTDPVYAELGEHPDIELAVIALPRGRGWWMAEQRVILVDATLDRRHRRCTVAHELEHALSGDTGCTGTADDDYFRSLTERRASARASRKLIPIDALADAVLLHNDDDQLMAAHLDVDLQTLDARRLGLTPDERRYLRRRLSDLDGEQIA